jgi:hypothetical protein
LLCVSEARAPVVLWARAFEQGPHTYTAAAYIQNNNPGAGARQVGYSFQLFDADNKLVISRDGVADLPPVPTIPIIETGINVGFRTPTRALFAFATQPTWIKAGQLPALTVGNEALAPDGSRLTATLRNDGFAPVRATVAAVLFDRDDVARAASKSTVTVPARGEIPLVFTWEASDTPVARGEVTILPLPKN